ALGGHRLSLLHGGVDALAIDPATPTTSIRRNEENRTMHAPHLTADSLADAAFETMGSAAARVPWGGVLLTIFGGALTLLLATPSRAGWVSHGPEGGPIYSLAVDATTSPSTVYAGTNGGGVFKTTNGGGSWRAVNSGLTATAVFALAVDATTSPSTVYAGTRGGGVFKTTNGGGSWSAVNTGLTAGGFFTLAVDAATRPSTVYGGTDGGGCKTTSRGAGWSAADNGLTENPTLGVAVLATGA